MRQLWCDAADAPMGRTTCVPLLSLSNPLINGSCYKSSEEAYPHEDNVGMMILSLDVNTINAASSHCAAMMPKFVRVCDNRNKAQFIWPIVASHIMRSYKSKPDGEEISCVQLASMNCLGVRGLERSEKHRDFEWGASHSNYLAHYLRPNCDELVANVSRSDCNIGTMANISSSYDGNFISSTSTSPSYALSMTDGIPYHRYHLLGLEHSDSLNNDLAKIAELDSREVLWAEEFNGVLKHGKIGPCNTAMYSWGANFVVIPMMYAVMRIVVIPTTYEVMIHDGSLLRITSGYRNNSTTDCGQVFTMDDSLRHQGIQPNYGEQSALPRHEEQHADKFGMSRADFNYARDTKACPRFASLYSIVPSSISYTNPSSSQVQMERLSTIQAPDSSTLDIAPHGNDRFISSFSSSAGSIHSIMK